MKRLKSLILLLSLLVGLLAAIPALAQEETPEPDEDDMAVLVEIEGEVAFETIDGEDEITVGGVIIAPAGAFNPADLTAGDVVRVTGYLLNDDTIQATDLEVLEEAEDDPEATPEATEEMTPEATEEMTPEATEEMTPEATEEMTPEATEEVSECVPDTHPVANSLAEEFELDVQTIIGWHCDGFGFGEIARALLLAENSDDNDAQAYLDMKAGGMGWGQIMRDADVHPSELAPGRVIGGPPDHAGPPEDRGRPEGAGPPEDRGRPEGAGPPDDRGRPDNAGNGNGRGNGNGNGRGGGNGNGRGGGGGNGGGNGRGN